MADSDDGSGLDTLQPTASQTASNTLLGPCVVGWMLAVFGAGSVVMAFTSYRAGVLYPQDSLRIKIAVWAVAVLTVVSAALNAQETYHYLVSQQRNYDSIAAFTVVDCLPALPQGLVQGIVQTLLAERAMSLVHNRKLRRGIYPLYFVIACAVFWSWLDVIVSFLERADLDYRIAPLTLNIVDAVWYSLSATIDIAIVAILVYDFRKKLRSSQGARSSTDDVLRKVRTGAADARHVDTDLQHTAADQIGALYRVYDDVVRRRSTVCSLIATNPDSVNVDIMIAFAAPLPALYSLSLFATLKARKRLRERLRGQRCSCDTDVVLKGQKGRGSKAPQPKRRGHGPVATFSTPSFDRAGLPTVSVTKEVHVDLAIEQPWRPHLPPAESKEGIESTVPLASAGHPDLPEPSPAITDMDPEKIV